MSERTRSASLGREKKKSDLKPRYWAFLFKNLQLAVDELYKTCETDASISECKEVILVLENYTREFHNLTEWFRVEKEYENTPVPQRPNSLAWEIRKSSPGKILRQSYQPALNGVFCRKLLFELSKTSATTSKAVDYSRAQSLNEDDDEPKTICTNCALLNKDECVCEDAERRASEKETMSSIKEAITKDVFVVESPSPTVDDMSGTWMVKKQLTNGGRKVTVGGKSYTKKMARSLSVSNACETRNASPSVPPSSVKRFPTCVSPRKPLPGRNPGAAVFIPRDKMVKGDVDGKPSGVLDVPADVKTKIPRSQSDPVLDNSADGPQKIALIREKPYVSAEQVKDDLDKVDSLASSVNSLHVINEKTRGNNTSAVCASSESVVPGESLHDCDPIRKKSNEEDAAGFVCPDNGNGNSNGILVNETSSKEAVSVIAKSTSRIPSRNDSRRSSATNNLNTGEKNTNNCIKTTVNGEKKNDSTKNKRRAVVGSSSLAAASRPATKSRQSNGIYRVGGLASASKLERRPTNPSTFSKSKPNSLSAAPPRCQIQQINDISNLSAKTDNESEKKRTTIVLAQTVSLVAEKKESNDATRQNELNGCDEKRNYNYSKTTAPKATTTTTTVVAIANSNSPRDCIERKSSARYSNNKIVRSRTSADLNYTGRRSRASTVVAAVAAADANVSKNLEIKNRITKYCANDTSPRSRRSSNDTDGWKTVISKSRRSIPNSFGAKNKSFDVNNRFNEPSSSTSLPILVLEDGADNEGCRVEDEIVQRPQQHKQEHHRHQHHHHHHHHHHHQHQQDGAKSKSALETKTCNKNRNRNNSYGSNHENGSRASAGPTEKAEMGVDGQKNGFRVDSHTTGAGVNYDDYKLRKERPIITAMFTNVQSKKKKFSEKDSRRVKGTGKENKNGGGGGGIGVGSSDAAEVANGAGKRGKESTDERSNDDLLDDEESLRKSRELYEEEISLQNEINELQKDADLGTDVEADADVDVDIDSDSTEMDQEIVDLYNNNDITNADMRRAALEVTYEHVLTNMSWAERTITLDKLEELLVRDPSGRYLKFAKNFTSLEQFEDLVSRAPGRALELHQKLSSPSRKRISPDTTILQHKARQAKAKRNREQLLQDKSAKIRELFNKVAEVKAMRTQLANERVERKKLLEQKLKRAEENRNLHLKNIQEKAHDEAIKQREIAFINELEAQNKRHDFYALRQEQEDRFKSILEERQRRQEEKAAKEAAAEGRRKAIEAERQEKIEELQEKMRKREERIDRELQEKERERIKMAREKARDREDRLLALQAAQIANAEELQKKIQQKQESSARRHEENIELIRQKAIEIGTPRLTPYQINKLCSVCNVVIDSEVFLLSHLKGRSHQEAVKKYREQIEASVKFNECSIITEAPADILHKKRSREKERRNTLRKRCKKIRHRLSNRSEEYLESISTKKDKCKKVDSASKGRILKSIKEVEKLINTQGTGIWPNNAVTILERNLFESIRMLEKYHIDDQRMFKEFDGFAMLSKVYNLALDLPKNMSPYLPLKCFIVASNLFAVACHQNVENCLFVLLSNNLIQILDFLFNRLNLIMPNSDDRNGMVVYKADTVADVLMNVCSNVLSIVTSLTSKRDFQESKDGGEYDLEVISAHLSDVVSYVVCTGIVDKLAVYCSSVHDNKSADSYFLLHCMELLTQLVETRRGNITNKEDCTQLMATLKATELVGAVSMLYAILLHQDSMSNDDSSSAAVLRPDVVNVIIATLRLFSKVAELNLKFFQNILGAEGISLQVRHIISYLLRHCTQNDCSTDLLHQVIEFIGFFAIHHTDNQLILQSGSTPTVLQQLSNLPFAYFSNPVLVRILFPTLLACCVGNPQNRIILDREVSYQLLQDFQNAQDSKNIPLIKLLGANR